MNSQLLSLVAAYLAANLFPVVAASVLLYLAPRLAGLTDRSFTWLEHQTALVKNTLARQALMRMEDMVHQLVLKEENTSIPELVAMAQDGKLTREELLTELAKVKQRVLDGAKGLATVQGFWDFAISLFNMGPAPLPVAVAENHLMNHLDATVEAIVGTLPPSGLQTPKDGGMSAMERGALVKGGPESPAVPQKAAS